MAIAPIAVNDIAQVVIRSQVCGQICLNVLYYRAKTAQPTKTYFEALDDLMSALQAGGSAPITDKMVAVMATNTLVHSMRAQRVAPVRHAYLAQAVNQAGTGLTPCTAPNVAGVISKQTDIAGRGRTGSFHLAGLQPTAYVNGDLTINTVQQLASIATEMQKNILNVGGTVLWEPGTYSPEAAVGQNFHQILNAFPQTTLRVMRRRTVGVGI